MYLNRVFVTGQVGADPQVRVRAGGLATEFRVALRGTHGRHHDLHGKSWTLWLDVHASDWEADRCGRLLKRGHRVLVTGRLEDRRWTDAGGRDRHSYVIAASRIQLLGGERPLRLGAGLAGT